MMKRLQRCLLYPLLLCVGCHFAVTGSPIPLWLVEELANPQRVASVSPHALILESGEQIRLPYVAELPSTSSTFLTALAEGVEVTPGGEVYGLTRVHRICGNDPVVYRKLRVNLSDLAMVLHPAGLDDQHVPAEVIEMLQSNFEHYGERARMDGLLIVDMESARQSISRALGIAGEGSTQSRSSRTNHDRRPGTLLF